MTYLLSQIFISLLLAALAGGGIGWIVHGLRSRRREDKLNNLIQRQAGALTQAQQERQMIADDYDDMKLGLESRIGELQLANRKLPEYEKNLENSQQLVQQMMKSHESEIADSTALSAQLQNELDSLRIQQKNDHSEITALRKSNAELGGNNNYSRPLNTHDAETVTEASDSATSDKTNVEGSNQLHSRFGSELNSNSVDTNSLDSKSRSNDADNLADTASTSTSSTDVSGLPESRTDRITADNTLAESALNSAVTQAELLELESEIEEMRGYNRDHGTVPATHSISQTTTRESDIEPGKSSTNTVVSGAAGAAALPAGANTLAKASSGEKDSLGHETDSGESYVTRPDTSDAAEDLRQRMLKSAHAGKSEGPNETDADDLQTIHGIGPVIEKSLNDLGITSYQQIAELTRREIEEIAEILEIFPGRIERDNWIGSARKLAEESSAPSIKQENRDVRKEAANPELQAEEV